MTAPAIVFTEATTLGDVKALAVEAQGNHVRQMELMVALLRVVKPKAAEAIADAGLRLVP